MTNELTDILDIEELSKNINDKMNIANKEDCKLYNNNLEFNQNDNNIFNYSSKPNQNNIKYNNNFDKMDSYLENLGQNTNEYLFQLLN